MSFFRKLFGGGAVQPPAPEGPAASIEHGGFTLHATPYQHEGQWQLCGVIEKTVGEEVKSHRFIRADRFPDRQTAIDMTLSKGRFIIDENGERVFGH
jgi:hypothetical protein